MMYMVRVEHRRVGGGENGCPRGTFNKFRTVKAAKEYVEKLWQVHVERVGAERAQCGGKTVMVSQGHAGYYFITECSIEVVL